MEVEIYQLILISVIAFVASYIQSVTGFGFGIFAMIFLPSLLLYTEANMVSSMLSVFTSVFVMVQTFKKASFKNIIFPLVGFLFTTCISVMFLKGAENEFLTLLLGCALFALSIYFFFFSNKIKIRPTWYAGLIAGLLSGILGGLFAMSGPPVVIYFMQSEEDSDHYLATLSAYFVISGMSSIFIKAGAGFITANVWAGFAIGLIGMALGAVIGKKTREQIKPQILKKTVYAIMAISGIINIVFSII